MEYLEFAHEAFDAINEAFYGGILEKPRIYIIEHGKDIAGWFLSPDDGFNSRHEPAIMLNPLTLGGMTETGVFVNVYEGILDTMAHEAVHYWCYLNGIAETDEDGTHNEMFRVASLAHGLECEKRNGHWGATALSLYGATALNELLSDEALDDMNAL